MEVQMVKLDGTALIAYRKSRGLSRAAVARAAGISRGTVARIESPALGRSFANPVFAYCFALGLSVDDGLALAARRRR
jgi:transcriptional regulator with XRE-family HTH domain